MSTLRTVNQIMSIATKAHYLNGGNASKILAKDKKGIFTIEQVAQALNVDADELHNLLIEKGIMCGDYVISEDWGDNDKLSTYALRTLKEATEKPQTNLDGVGTLFGVIGCIVGYACGNWYVGIGVFVALTALYFFGKSEMCQEMQHQKTYKEMREDAKAMQEQLPDNHKAEGMM